MAGLAVVVVVVQVPPIGKAALPRSIQGGVGQLAYPEARDGKRALRSFACGKSSDLFCRKRALAMAALVKRHWAMDALSKIFITGEQVSVTKPELARLDAKDMYTKRTFLQDFPWWTRPAPAASAFHATARVCSIYEALMKDSAS